MSILYLNEHTSCFNYSCNEHAKIIIQALKKGDEWEPRPHENLLIFVNEGQVIVSYNKRKKTNVSKKKVILATANTPMQVIAKKDSKITTIRIPSNIQFCDRYSLERLFTEEEGDKEPDTYFMDINKEVNDFLVTLESYMNSGLQCTLFFDIKIKELFFILRGLYTKEELYKFFYPILSSDMVFSQFIQRNYHKVKTVTELAELSNYSLSGFIKKFKKVFGRSAYQWMKEQKAKVIYHEINDKTKTLKQITLEYGFSSPAHLNEFCKAYFNDTPGNIRKTKTKAS